MQTNDLVNELSQNFIDYAMAVNSDRAIPNAYDGLKPVAKRVLWGAYASKYSSNKPHVKAAKIVGEVMSSYHPHGDSSIYGTLVRLSQSWVMRYPLIDWHGNNGNIAGDEAASMRYTESRLAKITEDGLLSGIKKNKVNFVPNYDETLEEPAELPALFPNLLCNPNTGIGVALACNWAPHNLCEVAQAIHDYADGKEPSIPGPDFPTGGLIINGNDAPNIVRNGRGTIRLRAKHKIEKNKIIFYEIPYGTTIEALVAQIGQACEDEKIKGVVDVHDESNKKGVRIVVECNKKTAPEQVVEEIFAETDMQTTFSYNQVALIDKVPTELTLKDCIKLYLDYNANCLKRECEFDLAEIDKRIEVIEGLLKALEDIDNIIALIKKSASSADAKERLQKEYKFTEAQAKAIVGMKLGSLANLEKIELNDEYKGLLEKKKGIESILSTKETLVAEVLKRLDELVKKYGDKRRTDIIHIEIKKADKEAAAVVPEDVVVIVKQNGNIKRVPRSSFKTQRRNGKGVKNDDGVTLATISTNTVDTLLVFTSFGKMYRIAVNKVPVGTNTSGDVNIATLIKIENNEKVIAVTSLEKTETGKYLVFFTKKGMIKKTLLEEYLTVKRNCGIQAIKLKDDDSLANVVFMNEENVIVLTKKGMAIRFSTNDIAATSRITMGVKAIKLAEGDEVLVGLKIGEKDTTFAIVSSIGQGKRLEIKDFSAQIRGGKGVIYHKVDKENVVGAAFVQDSDKILVLGLTSGICVLATEFPLTSKIAHGNQIIKSTNINKLVKL